MSPRNEPEVLGNDLPRVARAAIQAWLSGTEPPAWPEAPAKPVFVTIRNPDGSLRGCIGSLVATEPDLARETARSAVMAATRDPRFPPMVAEELDLASVEVSVLLPEEPVQSLAELDPKRYGVIVRDEAGRRGLLLPDIPGVEDAATQVDIARRKGGISVGALVELRRFAVVKWVEVR